MNVLNAPVYLMRGHTAHIRFEPKSHKFKYGVTLLDLDIDRLAEADRVSKAFSIDRQNLVSVNTKKRGEPDKASMSEWARDLFLTNGIDPIGCQIRMITFPRTEFFSFSPLSVWLLIDKDTKIRGVIYEVNNTFGERHSYVAGPPDKNEHHYVDKIFHVSPFFDVTGQYRFTISHSEENLDLLIENIVDGKRVHSASLILHRKPAKTSAFLRFLLTSPFAGIGVVAAIHWEALKLFIKGMKYHPKPSPPRKSSSRSIEASAQANMSGNNGHDH